MPGSVRAMASPRAPARRRAYGSRKCASGRSLSIARYRATQRAVSLMFSIEGSAMTANAERIASDR